MATKTPRPVLGDGAAGEPDDAPAPETAVPMTVPAAIRFEEPADQHADRNTPPYSRRSAK